MTDLLTGSPAKKICSFCVPLLIGNLFQQLYSLADSMIVGQFMGTDAFAGVGSTGSINFLVLGFMLGLCSGFSIPIAQDFGAGNMQGVRRLMGGCIYMGVLMTVVITALMAFFTDDVLILLQTPADLFEYAYGYIFIIFMGMGVCMLYNMLACILRAVGDSRTPLYFLILACLVNIGLDLLFIPVFHMGVAGAAYATLISQLLSGILCIVYMVRRFPQLHLKRSDLIPSHEISARLFHYGVPMGLQFSITAIGSVCLQSAVNSLGKVAVAAMSAAGRVSNLIVCPMDSLGVAMATYTGQNLGADKLPRIRQGVKQMMGIGLVFCVLACIVCIVAGGFFTELFVSAAETEVVSLTHHFLIINGLFYPTLLIIYIFRNVVQGLGYSREAMLAGLFELVGRCAVAFLFIPRYGFSAACYASPAAWVAADILLLYLYKVKMGALVRWEKAKARAAALESAAAQKRA